MTEDTELKPDPAAPVPPSPAAGEPRRSHRARRFVTWVLVVLFGLLTPITLLSAWAIRTVTDTNRYVATLAPLVEDKALTNYVADQATQALFTQLGVQSRIKEALPKPAAFIAAPVTAEIQKFADGQMRRAASSQRFKDFWNKENRFTHATAVAILTGKTPPAVSKARSVVVSITPVVTQGIDELDKRGVTVFNGVKDQLATNKLLSLQLFSSKQVKQAQAVFSLAVTLRWALLIGTPLIGLAAIAVAVDRRRAALRTMLAGVLGCLALASVLVFARDAFITASGSMPEAVAQSLFDTLVHFLQQSLRWILAIMAIAAFVLWAFGPSTWAQALRHLLRNSGQRLEQATEQVRESEAVERALALLGQARRFVAGREAPFRWAGVIVAAAFLLTASTPAGVGWTLLLLGVYELALVWVVRPGRGSSSPSDDAASGAPEASSTS